MIDSDVPEHIVQRMAAVWCHAPHRASLRPHRPVGLAWLWRLWLDGAECGAASPVTTGDAGCQITMLQPASLSPWRADRRNAGTRRGSG